ncbi:MAG: sensor domain-containing diguanylate cyclase [Pseudomonadota bacterium]
MARLLFNGTLLAVAAMLCVMGALLWQMRQEAWRGAEQDARNLLGTIVGSIDSTLSVYAFALDFGAEAWDETHAKGLPDDTRHRLLRAISEKARHLDLVFVLDMDGNVVSESRHPSPRQGNFSDRDYFQVHRDAPAQGQFLSAPHRSRTDGDPFFALSRRLVSREGTFLGVMVMTIRLSYFAELFKRLELGADSEIVIATPAGKTLMRFPANVDAPLGGDISGDPMFQRMKEEKSGSFIAPTKDGLRLYSFEAVPSESLILSVAMSVADILREWRQSAMVLGGIVVAVCGALVGLAFLLRRELQRRAAAEADLAFLSITDGLTGLANRRRFDEVLAREWRRTQRTGASLALLFIDVDRFKQLNDRHGHARGDEVLRVLARVIDASLRRPSDMAARYGGEEFAVILPDTDREGARGIAEAIRSGLETQTAQPGSGVPSATVSIGIQAVGPKTNLGIEGLMEGADRALYTAKSEGRNRVVAFA